MRVADFLFPEIEDLNQEKDDGDDSSCRRFNECMLGIYIDDVDVHCK
jgi:hypothetical protein